MNVAPALFDLASAFFGYRRRICRYGTQTSSSLGVASAAAPQNVTQHKTCSNFEQRHPHSKIRAGRINVNGAAMLDKTLDFRCEEL